MAEDELNKKLVEVSPCPRNKADDFTEWVQSRGNY